MHTKTDAVILHVTPYDDKSIIVNLYTKTAGRIDCMTTRASGKKSQYITAMLSPLNIVNVQISSKPAHTMGRLTAIEAKHINFRDDLARQCVRMYIAELLFRTLKQPLPETELFNFIEQTIINIDSDINIANIHLHFMLTLSAFMGFEPNLNAQGRFLDLENGTITDARSSYQYCLNEHYTELIRKMMTSEYKLAENVKMTREDRHFLIKNLELYYKLHIADFDGMKSTDTLLQIFD